MRVLGIMSGTSIDGVDYVICSIRSPNSVRFDQHWSCEFPKLLKRRLHQAAANQATAHEVGQLHHDLGRFYAAGAKGAGKTKIDLVGLHGQTIFHNPGNATLQIGESAYLAEALRVPVVSNFRAADIAARGQGAPLATIFHRHLFARKGKHVAVNNLGGISNVTSLDWRGGREPRILSFDTGPANVLLDLAARHVSRGKQSFDRDGSLAGRGRVDQTLLRRLLRNAYFASPPPKSTGRESFGEPLFQRIAGARLSPNDLLATLTDFTARSIALSYRLHLRSFPDEVILCGGGAQNKFLSARIATTLHEIRPDTGIHSSNDFGWHPQAIEPAAFALLSWLTWNKRAGNIPATTGAKGPRVLGQICDVRSANSNGAKSARLPAFKASASTRISSERF